MTRHYSPLILLALLLSYTPTLLAELSDEVTLSSRCQQAKERNTRSCREERRRLEREARAEDSAYEEEEEEEVVPEEKEREPVPEILDFEERNAEMYRFDFTPYSGFYLGDTLNASYMFGGLLNFRLTPELSVGVDFAWSPIAFDPQGSFGQTVTNKNEYIIQGVVTINLPAAFFQNGKVFEADFFTTIGGGVMRINNSTRGNGFLGGGMMTYLPWVKWLGIRVEVRGYFSSVLTTNGTDFTTDVTITGGPTFMIPPRLF